MLLQMFTVRFPCFHQMIDLHMERIDAFIQFIHLLEIMIILRFKAQRPQLFQLLLRCRYSS